MRAVHKFSPVRAVRSARGRVGPLREALAGKLDDARSAARRRASRRRQRATRRTANTAFRRAVLDQGVPTAEPSSSETRLLTMTSEHFRRLSRRRVRLATGRLTWSEVPGLETLTLEAAAGALDRRDTSRGMVLARQVLAQHPRNPRGLRLLALGFGLEGDWAAAEETWRLALARTQDPVAAARSRVELERARARLREVLAGAAPGLRADRGDGTRDEGALLARALEASTAVTRSLDFDRAVEHLVAQRLADGVALPAPLVDAFKAVRPATRRSPAEAFDALQEARRLAEQADYEGALTELRRVADVPRVLSQEVVFELARLLQATSRYEAARTALRLAERDPRSTARAATMAAQVAWIQHDYAGGAADARRALEVDPGNRLAPYTLRRLEEPLTPAGPDAPRGGIGHVAFFLAEGGNFGDVVLPGAVRESIEAEAGPTPWVPFHAHQVFDDARVELANAQRALVVGGGGLFLPDTAPNGNSGWQWNVPRSSLERLRVPLHVYTVGYNLFEGQSFVGDLFRDSLVALAEKAETIGLRNHGSIARVLDLLPEELHGKVRFAPCPTTVLEHIHPGLAPAVTGTGRVLINAAFDRSHRRFADEYPRFVEQMAAYVRGLRSDGADVELAAHLPGDERLARDLAAQHGVELESVPLYSMAADEGYAVYRRASVVVGMRGHATMIPFGLGTPVLSLISHPKMRYFLDDIDRREWGFDVRGGDLAPTLLERTRDVLAREDHYRDDVSTLRNGLLAHVRAAATLVARSAGTVATSR